MRTRDTRFPRVAYGNPTVCQSCYGVGRVNLQRDECQACGGTGRIYPPRPDSLVGRLRGRRAWLLSERRPGSQLWRSTWWPLIQAAALAAAALAALSVAMLLFLMLLELLDALAIWWLRFRGV